MVDIINQFVVSVNERAAAVNELAAAGTGWPARALAGRRGHWLAGAGTGLPARAPAGRRGHRLAGARPAPRPLRVRSPAPGS
jgi:hypothetical protein